jgi:hypothetical protein
MKLAKCDTANNFQQLSSPQATEALHSLMAFHHSFVTLNATGIKGIDGS